MAIYNIQNYQNRLSSLSKITLTNIFSTLNLGRLSKVIFTTIVLSISNYAFANNQLSTKSSVNLLNAQYNFQTIQSNYDAVKAENEKAAKELLLAKNKFNEAQINLSQKQNSYNQSQQKLKIMESSLNEAKQNVQQVWNNTH